jgi:hypothetical protein
MRDPEATIPDLYAEDWELTANEIRIVVRLFHLRAYSPSSGPKDPHVRPMIAGEPAYLWCTSGLLKFFGDLGAERPGTGAPTASISRRATQYSRAIETLSEKGMVSKEASYPLNEGGRFQRVTIHRLTPSGVLFVTWYLSHRGFIVEPTAIKQGTAQFEIGPAIPEAPGVLGLKEKLPTADQPPVRGGLRNLRSKPIGRTRLRQPRRRKASPSKSGKRGQKSPANSR